MNPRRLLLELFDAALRAVDGRACVARFLEAAGTGAFRLPSRLVVIAVGKAAPAMALGAHDAMSAAIARTLVITRRGHLDPGLERLPNLTALESAHPVPDESSLAAGEALLRAVEGITAAEFPLFLVSGGSSSLVECLVEGETLEELQALNQRGLAAGWDIARLNRERARMSRLKAGGVARRLAGRRGLALFVSDVPGDDPDVIGSGLLGRDAGAADGIDRQIVASVDHAMRAVMEVGVARGVELARVPARFADDAAVVAQDFLVRLRETGADGLVWGGESTVVLPDEAGRGGRNQHLALAAARMMRANEGLTILAAGTDGTDGSSDDAGAMVDAGTITRAEIAGVDVERAWLACDSGTVLEGSEDLVHTGPTGTNVGDLLIGIRSRDRRRRDPATPRVL